MMSNNLLFYDLHVSLTALAFVSFTVLSRLKASSLYFSQ